MANNTTTSPGLLSIDPIQGFVDYVTEYKPYHTKIFDVLFEYVYSDNVNVTVTETAITEGLDFFSTAPSVTQIPLVTISGNTATMSGDYTSTAFVGDIANISGATNVDVTNGNYLLTSISYNSTSNDTTITTNNPISTTAVTNSTGSSGGGTTVNVTVGIDPTSASTTGFGQNNAVGSGQNFGSIDSDSLPGVGTIDAIVLVTPFGYPIENLFIAIDGGVNGAPAADAFYNVEFTDGAGTKFTVLANTYTNYYTSGTIAGWTFNPGAAIWTSGAVEAVTFNVTAPSGGGSIGDVTFFNLVPSFNFSYPINDFLSSITVKDQGTGNTITAPAFVVPGSASMGIQAGTIFTVQGTSLNNGTFYALFVQKNIAFNVDGSRNLAGDTLTIGIGAPQGSPTNAPFITTIATPDTGGTIVPYTG